jgi:hypothetical protein
VPIISADTMRHGLREAGSRALLSAAGIEEGALTEGALRLLWNGGMMRESGSTVSLEEYRRMIELLPHLALLGGATRNRIEAGQLEVDNATVVCEETAPSMPPWVLEMVGPLSNAGEHRTEVERYRHDALTSRQERRRLLPADRDRIERQLEVTESADSSETQKTRAKMGMMPHSYEAVMRGSYFYWPVVVTTYSDLEVDAWMVCLGGFLLDCRVGGKKGTGCGLLKAVHAKELELARVEDRLGEVIDLSTGIGSLFRAHVSQRAAEIALYLADVRA